MPAVIARLDLYWTILRTSLEERLVYRADFALGTLMRFLPIVTQILLWKAIFDASGRDHIAGFSYDNIVAYYLLVTISRAFSSMPTLASGIALEIRNGEIKKYLTQPIDLLSFLLAKRIAWKVVYYVVAIIPFALVFYLCRGFFPEGWPDPPTLAAYVLSLVLAFMLGFYLEATIGMIGFWFLEVSSLLFVYMLVNFLFSGHMFPLDFLPGAWQPIFKVVPLQYLGYFPVAVFLGKVEGAALYQGLAIQFAWVIVFYVLARAGYYFGVNRYSGFGG